jgi:protein-disulfide isomerase
VRLLRLSWLTGVIGACISSAQGEPAILEYFGVVSVDGHRFNGRGSFVFSVQETNGVIWWSSGEIPAEGSTNISPRAIQLSLTNGAYTVRLGDMGARTTPLEMKMLARATDPQLRVWFNDGTNGWGRAGGDVPIGAQMAASPNASPMTSEQANTLLREFRELRAMYEREHPRVAPVVAGPGLPQELTTVSIKDSPSLGRADAPVALVQFIDFECSFCKQAHQTVQELRARYVETGKLRLVVRNLAMSFHHRAEPAARAALCAHQQHQYWKMHDQLLSLSPALTTENLLGAAEELKLNMDSFRACSETNSFAAEIKRDATEAMATGINGTPTFILGKVNGDKVTGEMIVGAQSLAFFEEEIRKWLASK